MDNITFKCLVTFQRSKSIKTPHFTITAEGSCANWTSLNPSIIRVIPNYETPKCSQSALVEVVTTGPKRKTTAIIVESDSGSTLKCDIFVDYVTNVSVLTTTKSIYVESSYETLSVQGYDSENNVFTSLEGIDTKWKIDNEHLKTVAAADAKVTLPNINANKSACLIVQGTKVGQTWATVSLSNGLTAKADLVVVEPISLFPSPIVYILPYSHIPFKLCSIRGTIDSELEYQCVSEISLPSKQYRFNTSNPTVLTVDQSAYGSSYIEGVATVYAIDNAISDNVAMSLVYVAYPYRAEQEVQYIALGDDPIFDPILYTRDGHIIKTYEPIKWEIEGKWDTIGRKEIILRYHDFSFIAIVIVCPPIKFDHDEVVLPQSYSGFPLHLSGGSGNYSFVIENPSLLDYSNSRIQTYKEGITKIRAYDRLIRKYETFCTVIISKVEYVDIKLEKRELLIGSTFSPKCDVFAIEKRRFSVEVMSRFVSEQTEIVSSKLIALHPGFSNIMCSAEGTTSESIKVSVADYLRVEMKGRTSPNSITPITIAGGVLQWPNSPPPSLNITCPGANTTILQHNHFSIDSEYNGECEVTMQNKKTHLNPEPLVLTQKFHLDCSKVNYLKLHVVDEKASTFKECNSPPQKLTSNVSNLYKIVPDHLHKLYVFAHDIYDNIINYYSIITFELRTSNNQILKPLDTHGFDGETIYHFVPRQDVDLSVVSPDLETVIVSLKSILPFYTETSKTVYHVPNKNYTFHIEGGSGLFQTTTENSYIYKDNLIVYPKNSGITHYNLSDLCTDYQPLDIELNSIVVKTLEIIAPTSIPVGIEFQPIVNAYDEDHNLIPFDLLKYAEIKLIPNEAEQININTWKLIPTKTGILTLIAKASNGVTAELNVTVIKPLLISPQYITLLPGETEHLTIIEGPSDIEFNYGDGKIAEINGLEVIANNPGKVIINATIKGIDGIQPFPIYVKVLTPISLEIIPSTKEVIEEGLLILNLIVKTNEEDRIPRKAQWLLSNNEFPYYEFNSSTILINCTSDKELYVKVNAYSLTTTYNVNIESKLILLSPNQIILPPLCSYQIKINNNLQCQYISDNESIIIIDNNGLIKSNINEGETTIHVQYCHQIIPIHIRVSNPSILHIHQIVPSEFRLLLLDPFGLEYTSTNGINYELTSISENFRNNGIDINGYCKTEFLTQETIELNAIAYNSEFKLITSMNISVIQKITPENVYLQKGITYKFHCTSSHPNWFTSDRSIAQVNNEGIVTALRSGKTTLSCNTNIDTNINIVDLTDIQIFNNIPNQFQVKPLYSNNVIESKVIKPLDNVLKCEIDNTYCGVMSPIINSTGYFCIFEPNPKSQCPPKTKLKVTLSSTSGRNQVTTEYPIGYSDKINFGFPNGIRVSVSSLNRKVEIPFKLKQSEIKYETPKGITLSFPNNGGIILRADDSFKTNGIVVIEHKLSGEYHKIEVVHEQAEQQKSMFHKRDFRINQDLLFYMCLIALFACIWYIIFMITSKK